MDSHNDGVSRLFLSADLVGSTARKQTDMATWLDDALGFYQQFPVLVSDSLAEVRSSYHYESPVEPPEPALWKAIGDELIFSCPVREEHHVHLAVKGFVGALRAWDELAGRKSLPLKGGAWIATFPLPDRAVAVIGDPAPLIPTVFDPGREPEHNNRSLLTAIEAGQHGNAVWVDYVGPSMDTGFRLASQANPRRFMVSLEVAWLYAMAAPQGPGELYLQGEVPMKGVWGGRGYPLFWLDTGYRHAGQTNPDEIAGTGPADFAQVCNLARALCTKDPTWVTKIYLPDTNHLELKAHHAAIDEEVERLGQVEDTQGEVPDLP